MSVRGRRTAGQSYLLSTFIDRLSSTRILQYMHTAHYGS